MSRNTIIVHVKYLLLMPDFCQNLNVSTKFGETPQYQISRNLTQRFSSCLMCTDGQTDGISEFNMRSAVFAPETTLRR
jgi:hypothetical protein